MEKENNGVAREGRISVVMNTFNAAEHLEKVLRSVSKFDEIVLVDMMSTDATREIAKKYGARIVDFERCGICEPARNAAIQAASNPWVLIVDADEVVPEKLRLYLYDLIKSGDAPEGLRIPRRNWFMKKEMHSLYPDYVTRFARKDAIFWPATIHALPEIEGRTESIPRSRKELAFIHLENNQVASRLEKMVRYSDMELKRRGARKYGKGAYLIKPFGRFFRSYVLKGGWKDGHPGFLWALLEAQYKLATISRQDEREREKNETR